MTRGDVWIAQVGRKSRPVLVLTRPEVIDVRELLTVAEITTTIRGLAVEVDVAGGELGLGHPSVINCDGLHTVGKATLTKRIGSVSDDTMSEVCLAIHHALGC